MHQPLCISRYASATCTTLFLSAIISDLVKGDLPRPLAPTMGMPTDFVVDFVVGTLLDPVHSLFMGDVDFPPPHNNGGAA